MTDQQFKQFMESQNVKGNSPSFSLLDLLFKFSTTVIFFLTCWLLVNMVSFGKMQVSQGEKIANLTNDMADLKDIIEKVDEFTREPRFTQKHFEQQVKPITDALMVITGEIKSIKDTERTMSLDLQRLQSEVEELKRKR